MNLGGLRNSPPPTHTSPQQGQTVALTRIKCANLLHQHHPTIPPPPSTHAHILILRRLYIFCKLGSLIPYSAIYNSHADVILGGIESDLYVS